MTDELLPAERKVLEELGHPPLGSGAIAVVSNLLRASAAMRRRPRSAVTEIAFDDSPVEELASIAPREIIAGYWRSVGVSWGSGTVLESPAGG